MLVYVYAIPVFVFLGLSSTIVANVAEQGESRASSTCSA